MRGVRRAERGGRDTQRGHAGDRGRDPCTAGHRCAEGTGVERHADPEGDEARRHPAPSGCTGFRQNTDGVVDGRVAVPHRPGRDPRQNEPADTDDAAHRKPSETAREQRRSFVHETEDTNGVSSRRMRCLGRGPTRPRHQFENAYEKSQPHCQRCTDSVPIRCLADNRADFFIRLWILVVGARAADPLGDDLGIRTATRAA